MKPMSVLRLRKLSQNLLSLQVVCLRLFGYKDVKITNSNYHYVPYTNYISPFKLMKTSILLLLQQMRKLAVLDSFMAT